MDLGACYKIFLELVYFDNHKQKKAIAAVECHRSLEILDWQKLDQSDQFLKQKSELSQFSFEEEKFFVHRFWE